MSWWSRWREWRCAWFHGASAVCLTPLATFVIGREPLEIVCRKCGRKWVEADEL